MSIDLLPNMNMPYVVVVTTYPGAAAEEVEDKVSVPHRNFHGLCYGCGKYHIYFF